MLEFSQFRLSSFTELNCEIDYFLKFIYFFIKLLIYERTKRSFRIFPLLFRVPCIGFFHRTRGEEQLSGERFSSSSQGGAITLTVRNASVDDSGRYGLTVRNDAGTAHSDVLLEVRTKSGDVPVFLRRLNDSSVKVGTRTRFLVEIRSPTQVKVSYFVQVVIIKI